MKQKYNRKTRIGWIGSQLCTKDFNIDKMEFSDDTFEIQSSPNGTHFYLNRQQLMNLRKALNTFAKEELGVRG